MSMPSPLPAPADDAGADQPAAGRFVLGRVTSSEWVVVDTSVPASHPRHAVARIYEFDEFEYGVTWLREIELRAEYASPQEVVADIAHAVSTSARRRSTRPTPIPHLPPPTAPTAIPTAVRAVSFRTAS